MWSLGINHGLHESSVCLLRDEEIVFATAEERISRVKQDARFPVQALKAALRAGGIDGPEIDAVAMSFPRPEISLVHTLGAVLRGDIRRSRWYAASPVVQYRDAVGRHGDRRAVEDLLGRDVARKLMFFGHHRSHAWTASVVDPHDDQTIVVVDGRGARNATTIWERHNAVMRPVYHKAFPDSLGLFYARITQYLGFVPLSDEWKVMGLAPYGEPGVDMSPFLDVGHDDYVVNSRALLGSTFADVSALEAAFGPRRHPDEAVEGRHRDVAFAAQVALEDAMAAVVRRAVAITGRRRVALAGGVAMNVKANGLLLERGIVDELYVQPAASDEGTSLGAAIAAQLKLGNKVRLARMQHVDFGEATDDTIIASSLETFGIPFSRVSDRAATAAEKLASGQIIGWFQGRSEFGPRALGHRSILADPRDVSVRDRVNAVVKFREEWRPFAPSVLEECAADYFAGCVSSPFMIIAFPARPEAAARIPAVVHVDGTSRVHTVSKVTSPLYWQLISEFERRTGVPVVLNTSFNLKGDAIVNTVKEAIATFFTSGLDCLVIGDCVVDKRLH